MRPQLLKELRCLLAPAIAALLIPIGVQLCLGQKHYRANDGIPLFALFTALLAASSFGPEWTHGTFAMLLIQPVQRRRIWLEKSAVLAALLITVGVAFTLSTFNPAHQSILLLLIVVAALGITPWFTLLFRDGLIAAGVTLLIEWSVIALAVQVFRWRPLHPDERELAGIRFIAAAIVLTLFSVIGWMAGCRTLQRWQDIPKRRGVTFRIRLACASERRSSSKRPAAASLVAKELRLHGISAMLIGLWCAGALVFWHYDAADDFLKGFFKFYSFVFPIFVGSVTIARERELGVLDAQRMLPVSVARQWIVKIAVCFAISFVGGIVVPWLLLSLRNALAPGAAHHWFRIFDYSTEVLLFTALAILTSSMTCGTLRAVILGASASFVSLLYYGWIVAYFGGTQLAHKIAASIGSANSLLVNAYSLAAIALMAMLLITSPTLARLRHPNETPFVPFLILRTIVLLTVFRLSLLFIPVAPA